VEDRHGWVWDYTCTIDENGLPEIDVSGPDGATTSIVLSSTVTITEPGERIVNLTLDAAGDLTQIQQAADATTTVTRTFSYNNHRLTRDQWAPYDTSYVYSPTLGGISQVNLGLGSIYTFTIAKAFAVPTDAVRQGDAEAVIEDPRHYLTTYTLDLDGRALSLRKPTGAIWSWQRTAAGDVLVETGPLGVGSAYMYSSDGKGDLVGASLPEGSFTDRYEPYYHQIEKHTDALGNSTRYILNSQGDAVRIIDALGYVTTHIYSNGLLSKTIDPLNDTTTYLYDTSRRL